MDDLQAYAAHLRALGEQPPTAERRAEVIAALAHKREGIQSVAAQVLGTWGGRESVETLRNWFPELRSRANGWAVRGVVIRQLAQLVEAQDVGWVLDLYFRLEGALEKHEFLPLVLVLDPAAARARLVAGLRDSEATNRQAAVKAIGNMAFPDRRQLLSPLMDDPDRAVQQSARLLAQKA